MPDNCSAAASSAQSYLGCWDFTLTRSSRGTCGSLPADDLRSEDDFTSAVTAAGGGAADPTGWLGAVTFAGPGWWRGRAALPYSAQKLRRQII